MSSGRSQTIKNLKGCAIMDGHFKLKKLLGAGAFGTVYLAERVAKGAENDGERFAVKVMPRPDKETPGMQQLAGELLLQMKVSGHKNVLHARELSSSMLKGEKFACVRMDLCEGDMRNAMSKRVINSESHIREAFLQVLDGVMHLHKHNVYHRDLKFDNVLYVKEGKEINVKIADFGLATGKKVITDGSYAGTSRFMPPECISPTYRRSKGYSPAKQDIWALGIMLAALCGGKFPWLLACSSNVRFQVYANDSSILNTYLLNASDELVEMLRHRILTVDPTKRASLEEIRQFVATAPLVKTEKGFFSKLFSS
ncbi:hypothetical protein VKT23_017762 [Stygiomarasmius scandens]|uniref:Protein kinase domain-containing protein n=1 Tax=Marasmiellus scandens TaxID=2682957 RepID=A0ABR1IR98_9AGAR